MKQISTSGAPSAIGPYSQAIVIGNMVYTSGQVALVPGSGEMAGDSIEVQTEQVMKNLAAVLEAAGASFSSAVKTTCFLTDMAHFAAFNAIYEKYFTEKPARSCVAVKELPKGAIVEVEVVATVNSH